MLRLFSYTRMRRSGLLALAASAIALAGVAPASAGTYPDYQCAPGAWAVSPGWSVYANSTIASTVLSNSCSTGGSIGDYVFTNGQPGDVTENGSSGSQVALALNVPSTTPDVSIQSIGAKVIGSSVTGNDAFLGFASAGQSLPGAVELPYGNGDDYKANDGWTLPQGARDFEVYINCSTDHSSPTCAFTDSTSVPALSDIELELVDNTPPVISSVSGELATAAASSAAVTGSKTLNFAASDADSGVRSATLTLTPAGGPAPYTHTFDFSAQCAYDSWNACPLTQTVSGFALNTAALKDDSYAATLTVTDAAGNTASQSLGTLISQNAPANTSTPTILVPDEVPVGAALTARPGTWSSPSEAGTVTYGYQWEQCDTHGNSCQPIAGAQNASYTPTPSDVGDTLRVLVRAADNDGSTEAISSPTSMVLNPADTLGALSSVGTGGDTATTPSSTLGPASPNGTASSEAAQLHLRGSSSILRSFALSAFELKGQLLNDVGSPIANATLPIVQQVAGSSARQVIADARTGPDGTFSVRVPAGPSRSIEILYRAFSSDAGYAAQAKLKESVGAGVRLNVSPRRTGSEGTIALAGTVQGPIPPQGAIVELFVHYRGKWEPFRTPRTNAHGHFEVAYQFQGAIGRFPFQAEVPAGQEGFPYNRGHSKIIDVTTSS